MLNITYHIHNTLFPSRLMNKPYKLECYITLDKKELTNTNTLAYWENW